METGRENNTMTGFTQCCTLDQLRQQTSMRKYLGDKVVQPIDTGCQIVLLRPLFVGADEEEPVLGDMRGVLIRVEASVHAQLRM